MAREGRGVYAAACSLTRKHLALAEQAVVVVGRCLLHFHASKSGVRESVRESVWCDGVRGSFVTIELQK